MKISSICIIDIGSARIKQLILKYENDKITTLNFKEETKLSSYLIDGDISDDGLQVLLGSLRLCINRINENRVQNYIVVATEIFRKAKNGFDVLSEIDSHFGCTTNILNPKIEGSIFFESVTNKIGIFDNESCLIDVGGGSVQIIYKESISIIKSIATGTFFLERQFQKKFPPTTTDLDRMQLYIKDELLKAVPSTLSRKVIVFGSNCMEDFIKSSMSILGKESPLNRYTIRDFQFLYNNIASKEFDRVEKYYPESPNFMYGADKALLNVLTIAEHLNADYIIPTNESLSTGLAYLFTHRNSFLIENKIRTSAL